VDINKNFAELDAEALAAYTESVRTAAVEAVEALTDEATDEQIEAAEALADHLAAVTAEGTAREEAAAARATRAAALRDRFSQTEPEPEVEEEPEDEEPEEEPEPEAAAEPVKAKAKGVAALAKKVARPQSPAKTPSPVTITAAADVPDFSTGQNLTDMSEVGEALVARMRGFGVPSGDGQSVNLQHYGVAKFKMEFPEELTVKPHGNDMSVLSYASNEARLPKGSLTAAGGWCAPSETLYDLCVTGETLDGILSIPEINISRGGLNFTKGPDFASIYTDVGFSQTEAQAIAGTTKPCYEVECPPFTEVRLDAVGLCIKAPILTNAAYPELVNRYLTGSMVAHAHKVNVSVIDRILALTAAALTVPNFGSTAASTLGNLELIGDRLRQEYKMGLNETLEVVVPFWVRGAVRNDLALRTGRDVKAITDAMISAEFSARNMNVQYVYGWQELADFAANEGYPATFDALIYPAGTFVKGTSDVITLNAVYDAASLATNVYTALFFEQGLLVANTCGKAHRVTLPVCNAGRTGAADVVECGIGTAV
jgi:hypothetical protein